MSQKDPSTPQHQYFQVTYPLPLNILFLQKPQPLDILNDLRPPVILNGPALDNDAHVAMILLTSSFPVANESAANA